MENPTCARCNKSGVQRRHGRTGPYLANVETYPSGRSYFRGIHTSDECDARLADLQGRIAAEIARQERYEADLAKGRRSQVLIPRYRDAFGADALAANWGRVAERWLP
jgi:hypothetical protein